MPQTAPSFYYTPMARLLLVIVTLATSGLTLGTLIAPQFQGHFGQTILLELVALTSLLITLVSLTISDEQKLKRWMQGFWLLPIVMAIVPVLRPDAPYLYVPVVTVITLVAISSTWRVWVIYAWLGYLAVMHVAQNTSIDPYALRFWLSSVVIVWPLYSLLSEAGDLASRRRNATIQLFSTGFFVAGAIAFANLFNPQASSLSPLAAVLLIGLAVYMFKVKKVGFDGAFGRTIASLFLATIIWGLIENGPIASALVVPFLLFMFLVIKPREAFMLCIGLISLAVLMQQSATSGVFAENGAFLRYLISSLIIIVVFYQLRQLQESDEEHHFNDKNALVPMGLFVIYGALSAALLYLAHGDHRDMIFAPGSAMAVSNIFVWILMTWMATVLTLEARHMRQVVQAMEQAKTSYEEESRKVATLMKRQAVDSLLGGLAHNLNNLIQPVLMMGKTLLNKPDLAQEQRLQMYKLMYDSAVEQKALLDQIFVHAREMEDTQLATVADLEAVVRFVKSGLSSTQQVLWSSEFDQRLRERTLLLSKGNLHTVLLNVINNGLQAAKQRETAQITLSLQEITDAIVLRVSDNGTGMSAETQRRAMDKFFTTKAVGEGTGLGLSEVQALLEGVQGELMIEGSSDEGTTMKMIIPLKAG